MAKLGAFNCRVALAASMNQFNDELPTDSTRRAKQNMERLDANELRMVLS